MILGAAGEEEEEEAARAAAAEGSCGGADFLLQWERALDRRSGEARGVEPREPEPRRREGEPAGVDRKEPGGMNKCD